MKLNELTKQQRERIEKYEVFKEIVRCEGLKQDHTTKLYIRGAKRQEIKRTTSRIEEEIEFLESREEYWSLAEKSRIKKLKQELKDYKLMWQLE